MRQTQAERSAVMRSRLLETAFECLSELGYVGTSTAEVCRRGGFSRGALLHHYPTKQALLAGAAAYVFEKRIVEYRAGVRLLDDGTDRSGRAIDLLWNILSGPSFYAWLELIVASRTDDELRGHLRVVIDNFGQDVDATFAELFPMNNSLLSPAESVGLTFAVLNGLAVDGIYQDRDKIEAMVEAYKRVARLWETL